MKKLRTIDEMPQFLSPKDLIELGLYTSIFSAANARKYKDSPDYIKFKRKILYTKEAVQAYLEKKTVRF